MISKNIAVPVHNVKDRLCCLHSMVHVKKRLIAVFILPHPIFQNIPCQLSVNNGSSVQEHDCTHRTQTMIQRIVILKDPSSERAVKKGSGKIME